jgi:hypothetical protein
MKQWGLMVSDAEKEKAGPGFEPCVFVQAGMELPEEHKVPTQQKYQRGAAHAFGWIAQRLAHGTVVHLVMSVDPQGSIPASLVAATNSEQREKLVIIKRLMTEAGLKTKAQLCPERYLSNPAAKRKYVSLGELNGPQKPKAIAQRSRGSSTSVRSTVAGEGGDATAASADAVPDTVKKYLSLLQSSDWAKVKETNGVTMYQKPVEWSKTKACYLTTFCPRANNAIARKLFSDVDTGRLYDKLLSSKTVVRVVDPLHTIYHTKYKSPFFAVQARDMVTCGTSGYDMPYEQQVQCKVVPKNADGSLPAAGEGKVYFHCGYDWGDKDVPPEKGFTRARVEVFGFMCQERPDGSGVDLHNCFSVDPSGSIPSSVVDAGNLEQLNKMAIIRDLLVKGW